MAGNAGAVRAGKAVVEIWADKSPLQKGLNDAKKSLSSWGKSVGVIGGSIAAAGAAIRAPILAATAAFTQYGSEVGDIAQRTGLSTEAVDRLGFAARQSGSSIADVETGVKKMEKNLADAAGGNKQAAESFRDLGLSVSELKNLKPEEQFAAIARKIAALPNPIDRTQKAMDIFGKSGTMLLPVIQDFDALQQRADRLGLGMSSKDAAAAHALGDAYEDLKSVSGSLSNSIGSVLAPSFQQWVEYAVNATKVARDWINENRGAVVMAATVGSVLLGVGTVIAGVGSAFYVASIAVGGIASAFGVLTAALAATKVMALAMWGALFTPLGAIAAVVALVAANWLVFSGNGAAAIQFLKDAIGTLASDFGEAFGAISTAMAAGDISAAVNVLWATLKLEWQRGVNALMGYWNEFKSLFLYAVNATFYGAVSIINNLWAGVETIFVSVVNGLFNAWGQLTGFLQKTWNSTIGFIQVAWLRFKNMFVEDVDIEAKIKAANDNTAAANKAVDEATKTKVQQNNEGADQRKSQIERDRAGADEELRKALAEKDAGMTEANRKAIAESEAALQKAKDEFKASVDKANSSKASNLSTPIPKPGVTTPTLEQQALKMSAGGTFSAFGGQGVAGGALDRTAKATEETAKNTKEIKKKTKPAEMAKVG